MFKCLTFLFQITFSTFEVPYKSSLFFKNLDFIQKKFYALKTNIFFCFSHDKQRNTRGLIWIYPLFWLKDITCGSRKTLEFTVIKLAWNNWQKRHQKPVKVSSYWHFSFWEFKALKIKLKLLAFKKSIPRRSLQVKGLEILQSGIWNDLRS